MIFINTNNINDETYKLMDKEIEFLNNNIYSQSNLKNLILKNMQSFVDFDASETNCANFILDKLHNLKTCLDLCNTNLSLSNILLQDCENIRSNLQNNVESLTEKIDAFNKNYCELNTIILTNTLKIENCLLSISEKIPFNFESTSVSFNDVKQTSLDSFNNLKQTNSENFNDVKIAEEKIEPIENIKLEEEKQTFKNITVEDKTNPLENIKNEEIEEKINFTEISKVENIEEENKTIENINIEKKIEPKKEEHSIPKNEFRVPKTNITVDIGHLYAENTLLVSEMSKKVILPYSLSELEETLKENPNEYSSIDDIIVKDYTVPISVYKNPHIARFKEAYKLMRNKEHSSITDSLELGVELMFNSDLHPAIISACKDLDELDIYLDYLEDGDTTKFNCFQIVFEAPPSVM